jgi:hypothetical protein
VATGRFRLFWTGDTISAAGGALSLVAIPLLALETLHVSDTAVGVIRAAQTLPFLLLAIPIGLLADRVSRRALLLLADALRFPLVGLIALLGPVLPVGGLVALVFLSGVCAVAYEVAYLSVLPELVADPSSLPSANRAVESAHAGASLLGPAAGGALVAALSPALVVGLDAISFALGAVLTLVNRWPAARSPAGSTSLFAGWVWLRRNWVVRSLTLYLAVNNLALQAFQTALLLLWCARSASVPLWSASPSRPPVAGSSPGRWSVLRWLGASGPGRWWWRLRSSGRVGSGLLHRVEWGLWWVGRCWLGRGVGCSTCIRSRSARRLRRGICSGGSMLWSRRFPMGLPRWGPWSVGLRRRLWAQRR